MRIVAFAAVVCLVMSPVAYADDRVVSDVEFSSFFTGVWEAVIAIPVLMIEKITLGTSNSGDATETSSSIEPPENDAGVMIIIDG